MAWRIDEQATHGEIDNRLKDRVRFMGCDEEVKPDLTGNTGADLAERQ